MPCFKRVRERAAPLMRRAMAGLVSLLLLLHLGLARAETAPEVTQLRLERAEDGVYLGATVRFELGAAVEDALRKGIALIFVAEAELYRDRWYWTDKKVASSQRQFRLAYQPLTRRWRLNTVSGAATGLGVNLGQSFDTLAEALAALQRIPLWKIADAAEIEPDARHNVQFQFRMDVTQLPRPFQIGAVGQSEWNIAMSRSQRLSMEIVK